ncbi:MAG: type III PLP-dependent enzyme, partial [Gammaproteobacteria bacterium]
FPGQTLFAVKTNPHFVETVAAAGIRHFDVASLSEIELVHRLVPGARLSFMHPVKSRASIRRAYFEFGVRDFALDCEAELNKILDETNHASDLNLFVRLAVSNRRSRLKLAGKFGISGRAASDLLLKTRQAADELGVCFHAGSQLMQPQAYAEAMEVVSQCIRKSGVIIDILDVGGGFPSIYPDLTPPPLSQYVDVINDMFEKTIPVIETCELWCEPGRALVAEAASLVVKVELRKDNTLYINDGTYGGLFDAGQPGFCFPVAALTQRADSNVQLEPFSLYGPTCDSIDFMPGPFMLPANIDEGDYIEIGGLGAYSLQLRSAFNGFDQFEILEVADQPLMSMYGNERKLVGVLESAPALQQESDQ